VNEEREFEVSDRGAFEGLLRRLGLEPGIAKDKRGWRRQAGEIGAELSLVGGLGWFLELEILAGDRLPETVEKTRRSLFRFLGQTGVGPDRIEPRYYTELLQERGA
jgi:predicted adenylyl cyclase CyaB